MHPLQDKVVLITGASSGIGRATAVRLAEHGAKVGLAARNEHSLAEVVAEFEKRGQQALAVPTDVTEAEQCRYAVEATSFDRTLFCFSVCRSLGSYRGNGTLRASVTMQWASRVILS